MAMAARTRRALAVGLGVGLIGMLITGYVVSVAGDRTGSTSLRSAARRSPFDGERAMRVLEQVCAFGARPSGSPGMLAQRDWLIAHFESLGGQVSQQAFSARHPVTGAPVSLVNLVVKWRPELTERILLCAHYDTRPFPDRDPDPARRRGVFLGANDGASGVALLAELAHHIPDLPPRLGIDMVLFDGEELVYDNDRDPYFLGSEHFARGYAREPRPFRYRWGVLFDMVGDKHLEIYQEGNSISWADTRPLVVEIWETARILGVHQFVARARHTVRDDHLPLHNIGGIPTCDIIDFDYHPPDNRKQSYWHTTEDTPDKCSAASLRLVGIVTLEWLRRMSL